MKVTMTGLHASPDPCRGRHDSLEVARMLSTASVRPALLARRSSAGGPSRLARNHGARPISRLISPLKSTCVRLCIQAIYKDIAFPIPNLDQKQTMFRVLPKFLFSLFSLFCLALTLYG